MAEDPIDQIQQKMQKPDGTGIYINLLKFYDISSKEIRSARNLVTFNTLMSKDLKGGKVEVLSAILTTFEYYEEETLLDPLFKAKVPITLFEDKIKSNPTYGFREFSDKNLNKVNMTRFNKGQVPFGSFHSKLILYEFDDFLRVIVCSANLTEISWDCLSQVIWIQDFPRTHKQADKTQEFKEYLKDFMVQLEPLSIRNKEV